MFQWRVILLFICKFNFKIIRMKNNISGVCSKTQKKFSCHYSSWRHLFVQFTSWRFSNLPLHRIQFNQLVLNYITIVQFLCRFNLNYVLINPSTSHTISGSHRQWFWIPHWLDSFEQRRRWFASDISFQWSASHHFGWSSRLRTRWFSGASAWSACRTEIDF